MSGGSSWSLPEKRFGRVLGLFLHQETHLRMWGSDVGSNSPPLQFFRRRRPDRSHNRAIQAKPHRFLQLHLCGYLEEMRRLNAGGEEDRLDVSLADGLDGCPKGSQIVRERPLVNGHACNGGSSFTESGP